jgi:hypothetical protein
VTISSTHIFGTCFDLSMRRRAQEIKSGNFPFGFIFFFDYLLFLQKTLIYLLEKNNFNSN